MSDLVSHSSRVKINDAPTASRDNIFYCCPFYNSIRNSSFRKKKIFYGWGVPESGLALIQGQWSPTPHCSVPFFCHLESILRPSKSIKISLFKTCRTHFHVGRDSVFGIIFKKWLWWFVSGGFIMYVNSKWSGYPRLSPDANWSSLARWNHLFQLSPSWPPKQTKTKLLHNWTLLTVMWLILHFSLLFLRLLM